MNFKLCRVKTNRRKISVNEKKSTFIIANNNRLNINEIKVDGCLFSQGSPEKRCDYLFELLESTDDEDFIKKVLYVELKGNNISHAYAQLFSTISHCISEHGRDCEKGCFIVASKVKPKMRPEIQNMKKKMRSNFGATLDISTTLKEVTLS